MSEGSITFSTALDNKQLEKDLAALTKKIEKKEQDISRLRRKLDASKEKSLFDAAELDAEKAKLQEIKDRLADIRAMSKDKELSLESREEAKALIPSIQEELRDQQTRVNGLQAAWNQTEDAVDRYTAQLAEAEPELERQKEDAGALQQQLHQAEQARMAELESAQVADQHMVELNRELVRLKERQAQLAQAGLGLGHQEYDEITRSIAAANEELKKYQASLQGVQKTPAQVGKATQRAAGYMGNFGKRLKGILASAFIFNILSAGLRQFTAWAGRAVRSNDEARQAIARLKGALLTLAQPLIEVVIPAFTALVNILARVVTAIAQFVSAIFGKTLKQSQDGAKALYEEADAIKGVGSAAGEAAGSLAGFDEVNTISTETASGSGGGTSSAIAPDFSWMDGTDGILDKLKEVADLVGLIAAGLALWKLSGMLPGMLGTIAEKLAGILLTVGGLLLFWNGLTDAWENGVDWANLIEMIGGLAAAALGLYLLLGPIAEGISLVVGGLAMLVTGFRDAMENGWNLQNLLLSISGILAAGVGIGLMTGSWIPMLIAGIAAVLLAITVATGHGEELLNGVRTVLEGFLNFFTGIFTGNFSLAVQGLIQIFSGLNTAVTAVLEGVRDAISLFLSWLDEKTGGQFHGTIETIRTMVFGLIDGIEQLLNGLVEFLTGVFTGNLEMALQGISSLVEGLKTAIFAVVEGLQSLLTGFLDWLDEKTKGRFHGIIEVAKGFVTGFFTTVKETLGGILDAVKQILTGIIQFITGVFTGNWSQAWEGVKNIFKGVWNGIISLLEGAINFIVRGINSLISGLNSLKLPDWVPGVGGAGINIPHIPEAKIPRLAQGAVIPPNREFMAVLGDQSSGNNLEAPEALIRRIVREESRGGGDYTALLQAILEAVKAGHIIMADRRVLGQVVTQEQNRMTRQSGRAVVLT